jgi:methylmalonic aciduria homocystinuria type C protein
MEGLYSTVVEAYEAIVGALRTRCGASGLDLVQPFAVGLYNAAVDAAYRLPDFGRADRLAVLLGNSRALWPCFIDALRREPARIDDAHPLDRWIDERVADAVAGRPEPHEIRFAHERPPRRVAMQRLAEVAGLAWLSASHLSVHPTYGPWIALRAVVVFDVAGPIRSQAPPPCPSCSERCVPAFERAVRVIDDPVEAHEDVARHWETWVAVRDACPLGRAHRYDDDQVRYHYTKDRAILRRLVSK